MPNFTGVNARPRLAHRLAPAAIVAALFQFVENTGEHIALHDLTVVRDIALIETIEIDAPYVERITAQRTGNVVQNRLDHHHALGSAEAAKGGIRHGVGLAAMRRDLDVFQVVGIVDVKHGAIVHGAGKIRRVPAARGEHHGQRKQAPLVIEAGLAVRDEVMAFAGHQHVGIAIEPQLDRSAALARQHSGGGGDEGGLALLAAESAAHAPALDHDAIGGLLQGMRHDVLYFSGMLRRAVDQHGAVFLR